MLYTRPLLNSQARLRIVEHEVCRPLMGLERAVRNQGQLSTLSGIPIWPARRVKLHKSGLHPPNLGRVGVGYIFRASMMNFAISERGFVEPIEAAMLQFVSVALASVAL